MLPSILIILADMISFSLPLTGGERNSFKVTLVLSFTMFLVILNDILPGDSQCSPVIRQSSLRRNSQPAHHSTLLTVVSLPHRDALLRLPGSAGGEHADLHDADPFCQRRESCFLPLLEKIKTRKQRG